MNLLVDIGHPAHVHLYKVLIKTLLDKGNRVIVTTKQNPSIINLLNECGIDYIELPRKADGLLGKAFMQLYYDWKIFRLVHKYKIKVAVGTSITIAHVSRITKMKSILFDDDDDKVQPLTVKYLHPFASVILSPKSLIFKNRPRKAVNTLYYDSYHELAYLHPNNFTPDPGVLDELGLSVKERFFILRFNVFKAHHDINERGLSLEQKLSIVNKLKKEGRILITTEREIEPELEEYHFPVASTKMHHLLYYASLFIGDSQTMTSEASVLGTPSIRCNTFVKRIAYIDEQEEKYELTFGYLPDELDRLMSKIDALLSIPDLNQAFQERRKKLLNDKLDTSALMVWFIENYPQSAEIMKDNPDYQYRFK